MDTFSRRNFIKSGVLAGVMSGIGLVAPQLVTRPALAASFHRWIRSGKNLTFRAFSEISPIADLAGDFQGRSFSGDEFNKPHQALWDLENYIRTKGGRPNQVEDGGVVIVGGGLSGLLTAYLLKDQRPLVLEQARRLGGNAKAERFANNSFSLGAAYLSIPEPGSSMEKILSELNLFAEARIESASDARFIFRHGWVRNFWSAETAPEAQASFVKVAREIARIAKENLPEIPVAPGDLSTMALDRETVLSWLKRTFAADLHPHIEEYFQLYAWSSMGGSLDELSAAQFLNFLASEVGGVMSFPGGNARFAEALTEKLIATNGDESVRTDCLVLEVKNAGDRVAVLYEDGEGSLRSIRCRAVVVATPKFVAGKIVPDISPAQRKVWTGINYRGYLVANVLLKQKINPESFDTFCLQGQVPPRPVFGKHEVRSWSDFIFADWANHGRGTKTVLTFYRPLPFDGARNTLYDGGALARYESELTADFGKFLPALGLAADAVEGLRLTRWGHSLPLARPGFWADGSAEICSAPHGRISFANQDCLLNPAIEACLTRAEAAEAFVRPLMA